MTAQVHQFPSDKDRLATLAMEISQELAAAKRNTLESAIRIGEHLIEAKKIAGHGNFTAWIDQNFHAGKAQASKYMNAAHHAAELRSKVNSELTFDLNAIPRLLRLSTEPSAVDGATQRTTNPKPRPRIDKAREVVDDRIAEGKPLSRPAIAAEAGVGDKAVQLAIAERQAEDRIIGRAIDDLKLSATAQQKLDAAIKAHKTKLEREFDERVRQDAMKWINEVRIPLYEKKIAELQRMFEWPRNAVMTAAEYKTVMICLHPDGLKSRTEEQLAEAFRIFTHYKPKMISVTEEESRKIMSDLPRTREELLARKRQKQ